MVLMERLGEYSVWKDGSWYRVNHGRKRIGSFLLLQQASDYMRKRQNQPS